MKEAHRLVKLAVLVGSLAFASTDTVSAATFRLKIGAGHPVGSVWIASIRDYFMPQATERIAKETGHKIEWTEAWGGSVCKLGECLEAVESGLLDIGELQTPFDPAKLLAHNFTYFVPFGTSDPRVAARATWEVYEKTPALKKILEDRHNQVFIGAGVIGNYGLLTTFKWDKVSELRGHKIAAAGPNLPWIQGTGVVGVQSNLNEAYTSFQTGVYEGWIMFPDAIASFKLNEVTKQFVDMDFGCIHTPLLTMNRDTWKDLPGNVQAIFLEIAKEWNEYIGRVTYEKQEAARKRMLEAGLDVRPADAGKKAEWASALPNIPKQRFDEINKAGMPGEVVYTYIKALKTAGHAFPRDWESER
jgi:TRAP-type C4-dicarboxylate transport system substrate-binding protein